MMKRNTEMLLKLSKANQFQKVVNQTSRYWHASTMLKKLLLLTLSIGLLHCGESNATFGQLSAKIIWPTLATSEQTQLGAAPPADLTRLAIILSGTAELNFFYDVDSTNKIYLNDLEPGPYGLEIQGYGSADQLLYAGAVSATVKAGKSSNVTIQLTNVNP